MSYEASMMNYCGTQMKDHPGMYNQPDSSLATCRAHPVVQESQPRGVIDEQPGKSVPVSRLLVLISAPFLRLLLPFPLPSEGFR